MSIELKLYKRKVRVKLLLCCGLVLFVSTTLSAQHIVGQSGLPSSVLAIAGRYNQTMFGEHVFVFDPNQDMAQMQTLIDSIYAIQKSRQSQFNTNRYALMFTPGVYDLDIRVGYYTSVMGLGKLPQDVVIRGSVQAVALSDKAYRTSLSVFWRSMENLTIEPTAIDTVVSRHSPTNIWSVSQAAPMRRVYVKGNLRLWDGMNSGGFMASCKVDGVVASGAQQQWFSRNSEFGAWDGGVWNMCYMGVANAPKEDWPSKPITTIDTTPQSREKPYLSVSNGNFYIRVPPMKYQSAGVDWEKDSPRERVLEVKQCYVAKANVDNAQSINKALAKGQHVIFTPGIYPLEEPLRVTHANTILLGLGMATLVPTHGNMALDVADVDGVIIAGMLVDAALPASRVLIRIGQQGSTKDHSANPTFLFDVFARVGGAIAGATHTAVEINSNHVFVDHTWLWRADHGEYVGWDKNTAAHGLVVNGANVTVYGLFNEHFQEHQTLWYGENGRVYFYQCEMPYDPPSVEAWRNGATHGFAAYKVADGVTTHHAWALGIYNVFRTAPAIVDHAIETPEVVEKYFYHKVIYWLGGNPDSKVRSIINGKGGEININHRKQTMK